MKDLFDVFLSHNNKDKLTVRQLAEALQQRGLKVWLDEWELVPRRPWQEALEEIIQTTRSAAVLVGKDGLGPWEIPEMRGCLSEFVSRKLPVIPVLLPDAPSQPRLPLLLQGFTWVDLRAGGLSEANLDRLEWGITGLKPTRLRETKEPYFKKSKSGRNTEDWRVTGFIKKAFNNIVHGARKAIGVQNQQRLLRENHGLQRQWKLLNEKLNRLNEQFILEIRSEEKLRLRRLIDDTRIQLDQAEEQLEDMESQLAKVDSDAKEFTGQNNGQDQKESQKESQKELKDMKLRMAYLRLMASEWRMLPLEAVDHSAADTAARRLTLEQVYISLDTTTMRPERLQRKQQGGEREANLSAVEALLHAERQRLVLLGQPGSGKSTFGRYLCLTLAEAFLYPGAVRLAERLPGWTGPALLPVFLSLRQFAASLTTATSKGSVGQIQAFIRRRLDEREKLQDFGEKLLQELRDPGGVVIFDSLDEVADDQWIRVRQALSEFAKLYPRCWLLVTCRVHSYRQNLAWQLPWEVHTLANFDDAKRRQFINAWYNALTVVNPGSPVDYQGKAQTLKQALDPDDPRDLRDLAGIPLLLTVMVIAHTHKELPDSRVGVYRECVDILLMRWQAAREGDAQRIPLLNALLPYRGTTQKIHQGLKEIAYQSHQSGEQARQGSGGRALVSDFIIRGVMHKWLGAEGLEVFLDYCRHTNGLLLTERVVEQVEGTTEALYVFPHLSFEEYLAALYLLQQPEGGLKEAVERAGDPAWWEVARFYGEYLCHDDQGANRYLAKAFLEKLCPPSKPVDDPGWRRIWLAGALLPGWQKEVPEADRDPELKQHVTNRLVDLLQTAEALKQDPLARAAAGRALANLGDPRRGIGVGLDGLPDFQWVRILGTGTVQASGQFPQFIGLRLGNGAKPDSEARDDENWPVSADPLELQDFELAAYPVTVAQFRPFVEQGGYQEDRYWSKASLEYRRGSPRYWDDPTWTLANHPVIGVSWYEAEAYCNWLNEQLQLPPGTIRLPTEAEWEWAARGPEGRNYPWGDQWESWRCNSSESSINRTSAVGCFPGGAANWWLAIQPDSKVAYDLAGNVWEWTASAYSEDYSTADKSVLNANPGSPCVLRGGSWNHDPNRLRGAARNPGDSPHLNAPLRGFRVCLSLPLTDLKLEDTLPRPNLTYHLAVVPPNTTPIIGQAVTLQVELTSALNGKPLIELPPAIPEVHCFISTEGLRVRGSDVVTLPLDPQHKQPLSAHFELQAELPGTWDYTVDLFIENPESGQARTLQTLKGHLTVHLPPVEFIPSPPLPSWDVRVAPAPDWMLQVATALPAGPEGPHHLTYFLSSRLPELRWYNQPVGTVVLSPADIRQLRALVLETLRATTGVQPEDAYARMRSVGTYLFDRLFPTETAGAFRTAFWQAAERLTTWLIIEDGVTWLPWELVAPYQEEDDAPIRFLSERYRLGRWVAGLGPPLHHEIPLGEIALAHYKTLTPQQAKSDEELQVWHRLLKAPINQGITAIVNPDTPFYGLHLLRHADEMTNRREIIAKEHREPSTATSPEEEVSKARLDVRLKRPVVTLSMLSRDGPPPNLSTDEWPLPERVLPFLRAGASAVVGPWWPTCEAADRIFWPCFYDLLERRVPVGEAVWRARLAVARALPQRLDWLAYTLFGDPRARPYWPEISEGYTTLECLNPDEPLRPGKTYTFRATLRTRPPVWYQDRLVQVEELPEQLQALFFAPGLQTTLPEPIKMMPMGRNMRQAAINLTFPLPGDYPLMVQLLDGDEQVKTLKMMLKVRNLSIE
ncbi:MAG: SUMF1/EgtB/PvdO family nonheme iron enzyme [Candidatus Competibacteraceae bacterium]